MPVLYKFEKSGQTIDFTTIDDEVRDLFGVPVREAHTCGFFDRIVNAGIEMSASTGFVTEANYRHFKSTHPRAFERKHWPFVRHFLLDEYRFSAWR